VGGLVPASLMKSVICCLTNVTSLVHSVAGSMYKCAFDALVKDLIFRHTVIAIKI